LLSKKLPPPRPPKALLLLDVVRPAVPRLANGSGAAGLGGFEETLRLLNASLKPPPIEPWDWWLKVGEARLPNPPADEGCWG
jgi:hypothetical protein